MLGGLMLGSDHCPRKRLMVNHARRPFTLNSCRADASVSKDDKRRSKSDF